MTTAHRPTFDPARGRNAPSGPSYAQTDLPAHLKLKYRKPGQGGAAGAGDDSSRDLAAELLAAEAAHFARTGRKQPPKPTKLSSPGADADDDDDDESSDSSDSDADKPREKRGTKRTAAAAAEADMPRDEEAAKRRKILEETRDIDADESSASGDDDGSGDSDSDSDSDSDAELQRELDRVRREKEERRRREEAERMKEEEEKRERDIALGNPLLNKQDFAMKRRWDDDVVFKNQARETDRGKKKEFVNDMLRSDFHKRFMNKYVR